MALDKANRALIGQMMQSGRKPLHEKTPAEARQMRALYGEAPAVLRSEIIELGSGSESFELRVLVPKEECKGLLVYYRGGGWVVGHIDDFDAVGRQLAVGTGCAVLLVKYRVAPEHQFPGAVEDAWKALLWAEENREKIAGARVPLIVAGDSAGGNLAAVIERRARDAGGPWLALKVLIYPVAGVDLEGRSFVDPGNKALLTRESMVWFWNHYVPDISQRNHPDGSPHRAHNVSGLPPAVVPTAEYDPLRVKGRHIRESWS